MKSVLVIFILHISLMSFSQDLKKHRWENRVLLIISDAGKTEALPELYLRQHNIIKNNLQGYIERKIIIYKIFPAKYRCIELKERKESNWFENSFLYNTYNKENKSFKVVLIGLDGGIKEERLSTINSKELFTIIDGMPMRKNELKK